MVILQYEAQSICRIYKKSQEGKERECRVAFLVLLGKQPLALDPAVCTSITFPVFFDRKHQRVSPSLKMFVIVPFSVLKNKVVLIKNGTLKKFNGSFKTYLQLLYKPFNANLETKYTFL